MESVPKLIPVWHDIAVHDAINQNQKYSSHYPPDYGGIGVDININSKVYCKVPKCSKPQIKLAADKCALPFLPLRKIDDARDPCLEDLKHEKLNFNKFCASLTTLRIQSKNKKLESMLTTLKKEVASYNAGEQSSEPNIRVRKPLFRLAETFPKRINVPSFNVDYAGGVLTGKKFSEKQYLLHPSQENRSQLCITPLLDGNGQQQLMPDFSGQVFVDLKNEPILQIEPALESFSCVRQKNSFHLVNMLDTSILSKTSHNNRLYHIAGSPYSPLEVLSIYDKGIMKLRNMATRNTLWSNSTDVYDAFIYYPTWRCAFGSHPFSAFSSNEKSLYCFDFREKKCIAREIFNIVTPPFYGGEELFGMRQWNKNPFQHFLTSSRHLILCDERYPKTPVMYWNHSLKDPPLYLECADFNSDVSIIVVGNQGPQQLSMFLCSHHAEIQPVSLNPPMLLSPAVDSVKSLRMHCVYVDDQVVSRLSSPLTGVCIVRSEKEIAFTVLQSTSLGDIFYQDFKQSSEVSEKTYHVSAGCVLTPTEKILPHFSQLISDSPAVKETNDLDEDFARIQINIDTLLSPPKEISTDCMLCRLSSTSDEKELVFSESCPMCNLSRSESQHFAKAWMNKSVLIGPVSEDSTFLDCDLEYLSTFEDTYSKRMLSVWLESDDVAENTDGVEQSMSFS